MSGTAPPRRRPQVQVRSPGSDVPPTLLPALAGRWDDLPDRLSVDELGIVAHMVNGDDIASEHLRRDVWDLATRLQRRHAETGAWEGNAVELLAGFFAVVRGWRGLYDYPSDGDEFHREAQTLYEAVRRRLHNHPEEVELVPAQAEPPSRYCFNWNLGNVKAGPNDPHMYLRGVWEVDSPEGAQAQAARANGLAHVATPAEVKEHGWACPPGKAVVVFDPPHAQCRFRAYGSLQEGASRWLGHHRAMAAKDPGFLAAINRGDTAAVAHTLKQARYYTGGEADYARLMAAKKTEIDRTLGPAS